MEPRTRTRPIFSRSVARCSTHERSSPDAAVGVMADLGDCELLISEAEKRPALCNLHKMSFLKK